MEASEVSGLGGGVQQEAKPGLAGIIEAVSKHHDEIGWPIAATIGALRPLQYWVNAHLLNIQKGDKVLEVGSGYPSYTLTSRKVGPEGVYVAVDVNEKIQKRSKKLLYWLDKIFRRPSNAELVTADAFKLPFADETFNAVVLSNFTSGRNVFLETWRVLKPGGNLLFVFGEMGGIPMVSLIARNFLKKLGVELKYYGYEQVKYENVKIGPGVPGLLYNWYVMATKPSNQAV